MKLALREVQLQHLIVTAVRDKGGAATKLSNRFLIGVSDLLIKLIGAEAMLMEAKIAHFTAGGSDSHRFALDLTEPQKQFLRDYHTAGMLVGVVSGVTRGSHLFMQCLGFDAVERADYTAVVGDHQPMGRGDARQLAIVQSLLEFANVRS